MPDQPADVSGDPVAPEDIDPVEAEEKPWWDDPRLPWRGKPSSADVRCWIAFGLTGVYGLVLLPLRPVLLGANPYVLAALGGSRTALVTIGAVTATSGGHWWPLAIALGTIGAIKFDPIYFWAGRLWGRGLVEIIAGRSVRAARNAARAERLAEKYGPLAIAATFVLPLVPNAVVFATVGAARMRWRTFLLIDISCALATRSLYFALGYRIGQPAVDVVKVIATYSWWLSLVLLAGIIGGAVIRSVRRKSRTDDLSTPAATD